MAENVKTVLVVSYPPLDGPLEFFLPGPTQDDAFACVCFCNSLQIVQVTFCLLEIRRR